MQHYTPVGNRALALPQQRGQRLIGTAYVRQQRVTDNELDSRRHGNALQRQLRLVTAIEGRIMKYLIFYPSDRGTAYRDHEEQLAETTRNSMPRQRDTARRDHEAQLAETTRHSMPRQLGTACRDNEAQRAETTRHSSPRQLGTACRDNETQRAETTRYSSPRQLGTAYRDNEAQHAETTRPASSLLCIHSTNQQNHPWKACQRLLFTPSRVTTRSQSPCSSQKGAPPLSASFLSRLETTLTRTRRGRLATSPSLPQSWIGRRRSAHDKLFPPANETRDGWLL